MADPRNADAGQNNSKHNPESPISHTADSAIDFSRFRRGQEFGERSGVRKVITSVPKRKPGKGEFFRAHPEWEYPTMVLETPESRDTFLVAPALWDDLAIELKRKVLVACVNRHADLFLWPVSEPDPVRPNAWTESAVAIVALARSRWLRMVSNMNAGLYEPMVSDHIQEEPQWPADLQFESILELAFKGRIIDSLDHIVIKKLRGLV